MINSKKKVFRFHTFPRRVHLWIGKVFATILQILRFQKIQNSKIVRQKSIYCCEQKIIVRKAWRITFQKVWRKQKHSLYSESWKVCATKYSEPFIFEPRVVTKTKTNSENSKIFLSDFWSVKTLKQKQNIKLFYVCWNNFKFQIKP